ncbi:hypothetical protein GGU11DRAFT_320728 [Lentinula aff. detonsa]|nr:hypothetical protein GGU11DRAFT_320728 [Lentinula aff. detonsa]
MHHLSVLFMSMALFSLRNLSVFYPSSYICVCNLWNATLLERKALVLELSGGCMSTVRWIGWYGALVAPLKKTWKIAQKLLEISKATGR